MNIRRLRKLITGRTPRVVAIFAEQHRAYGFVVKMLGRKGVVRFKGAENVRLANGSLILFSPSRQKISGLNVDLVIIDTTDGPMRDSVAVLPPVRVSPGGGIILAELRYL